MQRRSAVRLLAKNMKLTDHRGILQYVSEFREKTIVLALDGAIVTDDNFATLLLDMALLWSLNIRVIVVQGASAKIKALADRADDSLGSCGMRSCSCRLPSRPFAAAWRPQKGRPPTPRPLEEPPRQRWSRIYFGSPYVNARLTAS